MNVFKGHDLYIVIQSQSIVKEFLGNSSKLEKRILKIMQTKIETIMKPRGTVRTSHIKKNMSKIKL